MRGWWSAFALIALAALIAGLAQTSEGHAVLRKAGLYATPVSYSELAFNDPGALPSVLAPGRSPVRVSFEIHNVSGGQRDYRWSIQLVRSGRRQLTASGTASVAASRYASVTRTVSVTCVNESIQMVIRLASPAESIDFWLSCPNHSRSAR